jgi:5-methylcytosine-specific restriction endonuclease McrA
MKKGPATYECESCSIWIYEGTKDLSKQLEILDYKSSKGLVKGKTNMDHKEPVIAIEGFSEGDWNWHEFITRLFCEEEGFQLLCNKCHDAKTKEEDKERLKYRKSKKSNKKA